MRAMVVAALVLAAGGAAAKSYTVTYTGKALTAVTSPGTTGATKLTMVYSVPALPAAGKCMDYGGVQPVSVSDGANVSATLLANGYVWTPGDLTLCAGTAPAKITAWSVNGQYVYDPDPIFGGDLTIYQFTRGKGDGTVTGDTSSVTEMVPGLPNVVTQDASKVAGKWGVKIVK